MFPLGDENTGMRFKPWVLIAIIAANFVVWFIEVSKSRVDLTKFLQDWGAVPTEIMDGEQLYTLLTSAFLHGSWAHILGNMLFLWIFGNNIENLMGHGRFLLFYLLCAIAGSATHVLFNQDSDIVLVGASGAIAGVMGAYLAAYPRGRIRSAVFIWIIPVVFLIPAIIWIGIWAAGQFIMGIGTLGPDTIETSGVAYFAHIGGFVAGALLVWVLKDDEFYAAQKAERESHSDFQRMGPVMPFGRRP